MEQFLGGAWGKGLLLEYVFLDIVTVLLVRRDDAVATQGRPHSARRERLGVCALLRLIS
jgi:hypothetical protein